MCGIIPTGSVGVFFIPGIQEWDIFVAVQCDFVHSVMLPMRNVAVAQSFDLLP